jgi:spore germination protein GerM
VDPRWANALTAVGLLGFMGLVSLTAPRWSRSLRQPVASGSPEEETTSSPANSGSPSPEGNSAAEAERKINVKLFFEAKDQPGLIIEERAVPFHPDLSGQLRAVVEELIRGSQSGLVATLSSTTRVLDVFVTARGVAYVDLSKEVTESFPGGSEAERLTVYSVVNSITSNLPAIKRVQILVDDRPVSTLAGHMDLTRPLSADMTLLAAIAAPASESPPPTAPTAAPSPTS